MARRAHTRRLKSGRIVNVRASFTGSPNRAPGNIGSVVKEMMRTKPKGDVDYAGQVRKLTSLGWSDKQASKYILDHLEDVRAMQYRQKLTGR